MSEPAFALQSNVDKLELRPTLEWRAIAIAAPHTMEIIFYFGTFYFAGLAQWMVLKRITNQVNQHLPYSEQYVASIWAFSPRSVRSPINEIKVWRLHRQFFPESYLPWLHLATWALMIVFFVLCVQFDRSHSIAHPGVVVATSRLRSLSQEQGIMSANADYNSHDSPLI